MPFVPLGQTWRVRVQAPHDPQPRLLIARLADRDEAVELARQYPGCLVWLVAPDGREESWSGG